MTSPSGETTGVSLPRQEGREEDITVECGCEGQKPGLVYPNVTKLILLGCVINIMIGFPANWVHFSPILEREGAFRSECEEGEPNGCQAQKEKIASIYALAFPAMMIGEFLGGCLVKSIGSKCLAIISSFIMAAGTTFAAFVDSSNFVMIVIAQGILLLLCSMLYFATIDISLACKAPRKISTLFFSLFCMGYLVPLIWNILNATYGLSRQTLLLSYSILLGSVGLLLVFLFPSRAKLQALILARNVALEAEQEMVTPESRQDPEGETPSEDSPTRRIDHLPTVTTVQELEFSEIKRDGDEEAPKIGKVNSCGSSGSDEIVVELAEEDDEDSQSCEEENSASGKTSGIPPGSSYVERYANDQLNKHLKSPVFFIMYGIFGVLSLGRGNLWVANVNSYMSSYGDKSGTFAFIIGLMLPFNTIFSRFSGNYQQKQGLPNAMTLSTFLSILVALISAIPNYHIQLISALLHMIAQPMAYTLLYAFGPTVSPKYGSMVIGFGQLLGASLSFPFNFLGTKALAGPFGSNYTIFFLFLALVQSIAFIASFALKRHKIF